MDKLVVSSLKRFLWLFCLLFATAGLAQQNCLEVYDREAIYLRTDFLTGYTYIKNGTPRPVGFAYRRLRLEFEQTPLALPIFRKAQRLYKAQFWVSMAGLVGTTAGGIMALQSIDRNGYVNNERRYLSGLNLMLGSAILSTGIGLTLQIKSNQQLEDAIWLRNRELFGR
ncbi:MAG TPA: hypothetical protein VK168_16365 [Saprospiraceae bacterium]|nr:hypothetical protein [Saprospiraceae bacterium]